MYIWHKSPMMSLLKRNPPFQYSSSGDTIPWFQRKPWSSRPTLKRLQGWSWSIDLQRINPADSACWCQSVWLVFRWNAKVWGSTPAADNHKRFNAAKIQPYLHLAKKNQFARLAKGKATGDNGEVSTASVSTQASPTFSRDGLGAVAWELHLSDN